MTEDTEKGKDRLILPVVTASSEYLVMGYLMRRNILTYKAPTNNEGYDLICIHPDPRHKLQSGEMAQVRVQVKSRYQTDCNRSFPVKKKTFDAFDFFIGVFLNIGKFYRNNDGTKGDEKIEFYTFPREFIKKYHHDKSPSWEQLKLRHLEKEIQIYKNEKGFELIADALGVLKPKKRK